MGALKRYLTNDCYEENITVSYINYICPCCSSDVLVCREKDNTIGFKDTYYFIVKKNCDCNIILNRINLKLEVNNVN